MTNMITWLSLAVIFLVFIRFLVELRKVSSANKLIKTLLSTDDILDAFPGTKLEKLGGIYKKTLSIATSYGARSNIPAANFFNDDNVSRAHKLNLRILDTASGTLVGLGLLGTFLGLTVGILGFNSSDSNNIQQSIQNLLGGMGTAFSTSLLGMFCSLVYTAFDKTMRNKLHRYLYSFTEELDNEYYIDDMQLAQMQQQQMVDSMTSQLRDEIREQIGAVLADLSRKLSYMNEGGEQVVIANAIREILAENTQQTTALKSFSTDLAIELSQGFDEVLSKQMQKKILPLMENVDSTTKVIVEHIDQMATQVSAPATDMIENVVTELKQGMAAMVDEFKTGLSQSATGELENLSHHLSTAAQSMADFPKNMENISATLQATIEEVKTAISEISNTSATANSTAMQQMQEQIAFATGAISNAIGEVKEVMSTVTSNMRQSILGLADDMTSKQADLIALQEGTTTETKKLLDVFNHGLERMAQLNDNIAGTMNMFQQAQGQITGSTAHLQTITVDMRLATQLLGKSQSDYTAKMEQLQQNTQRSIDDITEMIDHTGELSADYVDQFQTIRTGLSAIFAELQNGLAEYSRTVQASTQKYLDQYSSSLTQTTDALSSAIEQQKDVVEMLTEALSQQKKS